MIFCLFAYKRLNTAVTTKAHKIELSIDGVWYFGLSLVLYVRNMILIVVHN